MPRNHSWSLQDDATLIEYAPLMNYSWTRLRNEFFPFLSPDGVRGRYTKLTGFRRKGKEYDVVSVFYDCVLHKPRLSFNAVAKKHNLCKGSEVKKRVKRWMRTYPLWPESTLVLTTSYQVGRVVEMMEDGDDDVPDAEE